MAKGFFTQGLVVLLKQKIDIEQLIEFLEGFRIVKRIEAPEHWEFSGPSLLLEYRPEVNGYSTIDMVGCKWPDHMGDPKNEAMLFNTWSMGHFGPYAYPFGLTRACQQSWRWEDAPNAVDEHNAFIRLRLSYILGGDKNSPVMPEDCDAVHELKYLTEIAKHLLNHQDALCYFNPNGEVLLALSELSDSLKFNKLHNLPDVDVWCNVRFFNHGDGWFLMDSIGNWQLDIPDQEVGFPTNAFSPQDIDSFIRNTTLYLLKNGLIINDGDTMDGPGGIRWQAKLFENGLSDPPREVLRWLPTGYSDIPALFYGAIEEDGIQEMS